MNEPDTMVSIGEAARAVVDRIKPDQYSTWRKALTGAAVSFDANEPSSGYWRTRMGKDGPFAAIAIWRDDTGKLWIVRYEAARAGSAVEVDKVWPWAARNPISHATFDTFIKSGKWPDLDQVVHDQTVGAGHNRAPSDEIVLNDQIEAAKAGAAEYAKITDDETAKRAQSLRSRLLELKGEAEKKHKAEKEPHLEAGRAVDRKWLPLAKTAQAVADAIRAAMGVWEDEKARRERERVRAMEDASRKAAAAGAPPPPPVAPAASASPIKGAYGRAAAVKVVKVATIADQDQVYRFFRDRPEVRDLLAKLAQKAADDGHAVPGITIEERRKVA